MKAAVIMRHTDTVRQELSPLGTEQMNNLARRLRQEWAGAITAVYTSPEERAVQCGEILCNILGCKARPPVPYLFDPEEGKFPLLRWNDNGTQEFVLEAEPADLVAIVTHLPLFQTLAAAALATMKIDHRLDSSWPMIRCPEQGTAGWFDFRNRTHRLI